MHYYIKHSIRITILNGFKTIFTITSELFITKPPTV